MMRALFAISVLLTPSAAAQGAWTEAVVMPIAGRLPTLAFDDVRGRAVFFEVGTGLTKEWDGSEWVVVPTASGPTPMASGCLVFDSARAVSVLFNGTDGTTWSWDGATWTRLSSSGPSPRDGAACSFDSVRGRVLLHGGSTGSFVLPTYLNDTWEWDGSAWTMVSSAGPAATAGTMAYDSLRRLTVYYGGAVGLGSSVPLLDTWAWDGTTWAQIASSGPPTGDGVMVYDSFRDRLVLSVQGGVLLRAQMWEWNGSAWMQVPTSTTFFPHFPAMAFDSVSGVSLGINGNQTLTWDGVDWTPVLQGPATRSRHGLVLDSTRSTVVLIGGSNNGETFEWDGSRWLERAPATAFSPEAFAAAFDPVRGRTVVFGGLDSSYNFSDETWEWDGVAWTRVAIGIPSPPARTDARMAYDPIGGGVLMIGGNGLGSNTWRWDGTVWSGLPVLSPPPRDRFGMATDERRNRIVVFGGFALDSGRAALGDTWEWDGVRWQQLATTGPTPRGGHAMAYDPRRGRVVLHGGAANSAIAQPGLDDTWEWDGRAWSQIQTASPIALRDHAMAFDPSNGAVVMFGSQATTLLRLDYERIGSGCTGSAGTPSLDLADSRPSVGGSLQATVTGIPNAATVTGLLGFDLRTPGVLLDSIGMVGCELHVAEIAAPQALLVAGGMATWTLSIPNDPNLVGLDVWQQCVVVGDVAANALGVTVSNATVGMLR